MKKSSDKLQARLRRALADRELVRVRRRIRRAERLTGYVLGLGETWLLMTSVDGGVGVDGYQALRLADVRDVKRRKSSESFLRRALDLVGQWPPQAPAGLDLDDESSLLDGAARAFPLLALHVEREDPDLCHIGQPLTWNASAVTLLEVDPDAAWEGTATRLELARVSRVDFGGRYEKTLWQLAGPPPEVGVGGAGARPEVPEPQEVATDSR